MANPGHRSIWLDHQMIVNGVLMRERKDLVKTLNDETGVEESHLTHTRVIGEKSYTSKQSISDGEKEEEMVETDMNDSELENFKNEWKEKWNPSLPEDEPGFLTIFFKMISFLFFLFILHICKNSRVLNTPLIILLQGGGAIAPPFFGRIEDAAGDAP